MLPSSSLPSLTGLRALAAALVFAFHVSVVQYAGGTPGSVLSTVLARGDTGVSLFFVLSGFVLAWSHRPGTPARTFLRRRFARVWPAHAVWVVLAVLATAAIGAIRHPGQDLLSAVGNLVLVSAWVPGWWQAGNPVAWSLVCEAFFYVTFPMTWWAVRRLRGRWQWAGATVVVLCSSWALPALARTVGVTTTADAASHFPLVRWPEFALGVLAAAAMRAGVWRGPFLRVAVGAELVAYLLAVTVVHDEASRTALLAVAHVLLVAGLARCDLRGRAAALGRPVWQYLGRISFAFYLCHLLVIGVIGAAWPGGHPRVAWLPALGLALLALAVSVLLADLTHRWVEVPARRRLLRPHTPVPAIVGDHDETVAASVRPTAVSS